MVTKKDGATTTCTQCGNDLICNLKDYGGNYKPTLQWQNFDGTAHYKTTDGKNFECNLPDEDEISQTRISAPATVPATTPGDKPPKVNEFVNISTKLDTCNVKLDSCNAKLDRVDEVLEAIFRYTVQEQLKK